MEDSIKLALDSYLIGRTKPTHPSPATTGVGFDHYLQAAVGERVPVAEQLLMRTSSHARTVALSAARKGHLRSAQLALDESNKIIASPALSPEGKLIVQSFHNAVDAYLKFKRGDYDAAIAHVFCAMEIDGTLITEYGYSVLDLHRIQLGHNIMRIDIRRGEAVRAVSLCAELLSYLEGEAACWPFPKQHVEFDPLDVPEHLRAAMFVQIAGELAQLFADKHTDQLAPLFTPLTSHAASTATCNCSMFPRAHHWLATKGLLTQQDYPRYLEQVATLLQSGPGDMPLLWRATAADLYMLVQQIGLLDGTSAQQIAEDAQQWTPLPAQLRALVGVRA